MVGGGDAEPKPGFPKRLKGSKDNWSKAEWSVRWPFFSPSCVFPD